jgi:hypothetical protein
MADSKYTGTEDIKMGLNRISIRKKRIKQLGKMEEKRGEEKVQRGLTLITCGIVDVH